MDKWLKIEAFINKILQSIIDLFQNILSKVTPKKLQERKAKKAASAKLKPKINSNEKLKLMAKQALTKAKDLFEKSKILFATILNKAKDTVEKVKAIDFKALNLKIVFTFILGLILPFWHKLRNFIIGLRPETILGTSIVSIVGFITAINIYTSSEKIKEELSTPAPAPTAKEVIRKTQKRSKFYKEADKILLITHVTLPVFIGELGKAETLIIDIKVKTSNMYIKTFLLRNDNLVKDKIITNTHPIIREFPLKNEGKLIIKNKIKEELNKLLKEYSIKGSIVEVNLQSLLLG